MDYDNRLPGSDRHGNWMQTFSGRMFWPVDPRPDEVFIEDIAHALSLACRFGGHCSRFYSVAEHSVYCSLIVPQEFAFVALMHDATEAYVCDIPRPLKPYLTGYGAIEQAVWVAIADRFGLPHTLPSEVKVADNAMLLAEQRDIMLPPPAAWSIKGEASAISVVGLPPAEAEQLFLARFRELCSTGEAAAA